ncbi:MAG: excinuclease [Alteromonadaceae bacterium]|nr:MAG: excinuclease [Alteromonadaceae bacterium]
MRKIAVFIIVLVISTVSHARDHVGDYQIAGALQEAVLGDDISFYFGGQKHPKIIKGHGAFPTNKKTNAFNKSDLQACNWVFSSAMKSLRDRARREGGNAVVNIRSNYKSNTTSSEVSFKCGAGKFVAGVALIGTVVTVKK